MRRLGWLLLAAQLVLASGVVHAQEPDAQAVAAARVLVGEGDALWEQGKYDEALDRFTRAYGLINAPTLALRQAECLLKLGRLVEASEKYTAVSRHRLEAGAPDAFRAAVSTAMREAVAVRERLPMLKVQVEGEATEGVQLVVDGREVPSQLIGAHFPVDPGERRIEVVKGSRRAQQLVTLAEKERKNVTLTLPPPTDEEATPPVVPAGGMQPSGGPGAPSLPRDVAVGTGSSQRTWGWVGLGIGAAGLLAGGATGLIAMGNRSSLDDTCVDKRCPPASQSDVDSYNQMRTFSTIGFGVGIVGVGAGLALLLTASDEAPPKPARTAVSPWVGVGSAGLEGAF